MILHDPSEGRQGTRMPAAVLRSSQSVNGLEAATGADFILSPLESPKITAITQAPVTRMQLRKHTQAGLVIQRKDGRDFLSSIPDMASIQERMLPWCGPLGPVMLIVGNFARTARGNVSLNGKSTRTNWKSYTAAKLYWQARGGILVELANAEEITTWVNWALGTFLPKITERKIVVDHPPVQSLVRPSNPFWSPLMTLPHIREKKALALVKFLGSERQTLAHALAFLSDLGNIHLDHPPGFGPGTFEDCHEALGLEKYERLQVTLAAPPDSKNHVIVIWPEGQGMPVPDDGRRVKLSDGRTQVIYSREELKAAMEIITGEEVK